MFINNYSNIYIYVLYSTQCYIKLLNNFKTRNNLWKIKIENCKTRYVRFRKYILLKCFIFFLFLRIRKGENINTLVYDGRVYYNIHNKIIYCYNNVFLAIEKGKLVNHRVDARARFMFTAPPRRERVKSVRLNVPCYARRVLLTSAPKEGNGRRRRRVS